MNPPSPVINYVIKYYLGSLSIWTSVNQDKFPGFCLFSYSLKRKGNEKRSNFGLSCIFKKIQSLHNQNFIKVSSNYIFLKKKNIWSHLSFVQIKINSVQDLKHLVLIAKTLINQLVGRN